MFMIWIWGGISSKSDFRVLRMQVKEQCMYTNPSFQTVLGFVGFFGYNPIHSFLQVMWN
jgi:hypothetical protein